MGQKSTKSLADSTTNGDFMISNQVAIGAGCYWGTEKFVRKNFQKKYPNSIKKCQVGFMSPTPEKSIPRPSYVQVCKGNSGHVEVLYVELRNPDEHYEALIRFFFQFHDPTTKNRQGNDIGEHYGSWVFTYDVEQDKIVRRIRRELQQAIDNGSITAFENDFVHTKVAPAHAFHPAHWEHQNYLGRNLGGYCNHFLRFKRWPESILRNREDPANDGDLGQEHPKTVTIEN